MYVAYDGGEATLPDSSRLSTPPARPTAPPLPPRITIEYVAEMNISAPPPEPNASLFTASQTPKSVGAGAASPPPLIDAAGWAAEFNASGRGEEDFSGRTYLGGTLSASGRFRLIYSCFDNNITIGIHDGYRRTALFGYIDSDEFYMEFIRPERNAGSCSLEVEDREKQEYLPFFNVRLETLSAQSYNMLTLDTGERENYRLLPDVFAPPEHWGHSR